MSYKDHLIQIGPLDALTTSGDSNAPTIVMFHGYGADASDLYSLVEHVSVPKGTRWVFPEGIVEVPIGPDWMGRAWFPIDVEALENAMRTGQHRDFSTMRPDGMDKARDLAYKMLKELNVPTERLIIGGFSQGAMLTTDLLFNTDIEAKALVTLSGALVDKESWQKGASQHKGLPFFQSHGDKDPLLSYEAAQELEKLCLEGGMEGSLLSFRGGHEIPLPIIGALSAFLKRVI